MLKKEFRDTIKFSIYAVLASLAIMIMTTVMLHLFTSTGLGFMPIVEATTPLMLLIISLWLGSGMFSQEKEHRSFEYLFSLRFSRMRILMYKLVPRISALLAFFLLYHLLSQFGNGTNFILSYPIFVPLYFSIFFFFASLSLIHRNNTVNIVMNLVILAVLQGALVLIFYIGSMVTLSYNLGEIQNHIILRSSVSVFFLLSVIFFAGFVWSFRRIDLANMNLSFSKKFFIRTLGILGGLFVLWVGINLFDASPDPDIYTLKDLKPATYDYANGIYLYHALGEPPGVNIHSEEIKRKYRDLQDPDSQYYTEYRKNRHSIYKQLFTNKKVRYLPYYFGQYESFLQRNKKLVRTFETDSQFMLERYRSMMQSDIFEDFSRTSIYTPFPSLTLGSKLGDLYLQIQMLNALEGQWEESVTNILNHIDFSKKMIRGSRMMIFSLISKGTLKTSLRSLLFLMKNPDFPEPLYRTVLERLGNLKPEEYRNTNPLIAEYLEHDSLIREAVSRKDASKFDRLVAKIFLQKNRTRNLYHRFYKKYARLLDTAPHRLPAGWEETFVKEVKSIVGGSLWWVRNPMGKYLFGQFPSYSVKHMIHRSYEIKSIHDMARIIADLHLNHSPGQSLKETLKTLGTYQKLRDPFSGELYKWNEKESILYSVGMNRVDDNGKYIDSTALNRGDIPVPY